QQWLRDNGHESLVQETVNSSTFKAFIKERMKEGKEYPKDLIKVNPFSRATVVKGGVMDQVKVLDHGFIKIRNFSGPTRRVWRDDTLSDCQRDFDADDIDPANTARMSFDPMDSG